MCSLLRLAGKLLACALLCCFSRGALWCSAIPRGWRMWLALLLLLGGGLRGMRLVLGPWGLGSRLVGMGVHVGQPLQGLVVGLLPLGVRGLPGLVV